MFTLTLPIKIYANSQLKYVEKFLKTTLENLQVEAEVCGLTSHGWVEASISGEDENVARRYLIEQIGPCPTDLARTSKFLELKSRIKALAKSENELSVDIGINVDATISLQHLQVQLADGRKVSLGKLAELFGFCENMPLAIKILDVDENTNRAKAILAESQLDQYKNWTKSLLDRLIILGASSYEVKLTLKETNLQRDVLDTESLGLFEYAVKCKLGTDAQGLIPKIGKRLRNATFAVFNPKKVLEFFNDSIVFISK
jgi:hypothetical protein